MTGGRPPAPTTDRDIFILTAFRRANGRLVEAREMLLACLTFIDIEALARRTGEAKDALVSERLAARRRVLQALGD